ncbi:hypothetical protein NA57DRAFT_51687 [Rhizodiscina lignyota]|uniref:Uncharacterized protein n=1 Tax=Rhizodiscina lignyota TaxID=1504668 RepID=A0A9P4MB96_9PEZI|nr:hypothetical protein NA57DRAFT_51687 [Rhizodiscina lignyota]
MQFSTIVLTTLLAASSTFADTTTPSRRSLQGHQHCHVEQVPISEGHYTVKVGVPFNSGTCDDVKTDIRGQLFADDVQCSLMPNRFTLVTFTTALTQAKKINKILEFHFPGVNGFNCPGE